MSSILSQFVSVYKDLVHLHSLIQKVKYKQRELSWSYFILSGCKTIFMKIAQKKYLKHLKTRLPNFLMS